MNEFDQRPNFEPDDDRPRPSRALWFLQRLQRVFILITIMAGFITFANGASANPQQRLYRILLLGFGLAGVIVTTVLITQKRSQK